MEPPQDRPAFLVRLFSFHDIYNRRVAGTTLAYLDNSAWIELRDAGSDNAAACLRACKRAVEAERIVFPVSWGSISELFENPSGFLRRQQAALMDRLSRGVCFRYSPAVFRLEAQAGYKYLIKGSLQPVVARDVVSLVPEYLGDCYLDFPIGLSVADIAQLIAHLGGWLEQEPMTRLIEHQDFPRLQTDHDRSAETYTKRMEARLNEAAAHFRHGGKLHGKRILLEERVYLFKEYVLPELRRCLFAEYGPERGIQAIQEVIANGGEGSEERLSELFRTVMPALDVYAHMMSSKVLNPGRRVRRQDFWDMEHAVVASVYADAFVTFDKALASTLSAWTASSTPRAKLITSLPELLGWIECQLSS